MHLPVLPMKIGKISIVVEHHNLRSSRRDVKTVQISVSCTVHYCVSDTSECSTLFQYDGVKSYWHTPYFIDLINSGAFITPDLRIPIPERFFVPSSRTHAFVPGSEKAVVTVVGGSLVPFMSLCCLHCLCLLSVAR